MRNTFINAPGNKAPGNKAPGNKAPGPSAPGTNPGSNTGAPGNGTPGGRTPGTRTPSTRPPGTRSPGTRAFWAAAAVGLVALSGCDQIDPLKRPYMWHATGVNEQNIAAMAVNPADLVHGRDSTQRRVIVESDGVNRLWSGHPLPLLSDTPGASASTSSSTGGGSGGATPTTGGGS
jgi:hypothetical protein